MFSIMKRYRILSIYGGSGYMAIIKKSHRWYAISKNLPPKMTPYNDKKYEWFYGNSEISELESYHLDYCVTDSIQECRDIVERHKNIMTKIKVIEKL